MNQSSATDQLLESQNQISIFDDPYEKEVLIDNYVNARKKTKYALFSISLVFLITSIIGFMTAGASIVENLPYILLLPVLFAGLGLFAHVQPIISMFAAVGVIMALTVYNYMQLGAYSLIAGWLYKVIVLYFLIRGFQHAKDAERAKKAVTLLG